MTHLILGFLLGLIVMYAWGYEHESLFLPCSLATSPATCALSFGRLYQCLSMPIHNRQSYLRRYLCPKRANTLTGANESSYRRI